MKALRKGVSPVIATLLLILIAVAAAVLLYTWVGSLSANVAGSQVTGKTLTVIQATWAMGDYRDGTGAGFKVDYPVLIISFKAPPAAVGGAGAGQNLVTIDNVDVIYAGRILCHYAAFLQSTDDQHTGSTAGGLQSYGIAFAGFGGQTAGQLDGNDQLPPGGIVLAFANTQGVGAKGQVTDADLTDGITAPTGTTTAYIYATDGTNTYTTDSFATIVAGVWEVTYPSTNKVETNFKSTNAVIRYDRWTGSTLNVAYHDGTNAQQRAIDTFDLAKVGQDDWSLVIWCQKVNPNVMDNVDIRLQFQDGSTWETTVPLTVQ
ncbi:hypothetical protein EYM_02110 [Ignicoccus islandicus DSM 13165]|uniref:Archaeal Type IV pilin N-terminal domain-containing protein n=1 Tax=Ignicoccus islandicus DSM 13165 TaxID=940295 RepID=A0A0U3EAD7_9CREN|nr:archaellin/type IV pilin N-terminal domain-containing protein [Ignicoccus islandicus]ALU12286.1 hypothetical protein EYM_02110 [Ignicoccus islandicus DSM 13165]